MSNFKDAFATARKSGKKVFTWNGKSYNTKLAPDGVKLPKNGPIPTPRPDAAKPTPPTGRDRFGPKPEAPYKPKTGMGGAIKGMFGSSSKPTPKAKPFQEGSDRSSFIKSEKKNVNDDMISWRKKKK